MAPLPRSRTADTAQRTLDVAERLVQTRGYNAFSYADIAAELHISTASLHYHFPTKAALGEALITRYATRFAAALDAIDRDLVDAQAKLRAYVEIYTGVLADDRMCLCGTLAAEYATLPTAMADSITRFFQSNETWLTRVLEEGKADGSLSPDLAAAEAAQTILSALEGAMLIARTYGGVARFETSAKHLLASVFQSAVPNARR